MESDFTCYPNNDLCIWPIDHKPRENKDSVTSDCMRSLFLILVPIHFVTQDAT